MDKKTLVTFGDEQITGGWELLTALEQAGFPIRAAWWSFIDEAQCWRLFIASPYADKEGPLKSYRLARAVLDKLKRSAAARPRPIQIASVELDDVTLLGTRDATLKQFQELYPAALKKSRKKLTSSGYDITWLGRQLVYLFPAN